MDEIAEFIGWIVIIILGAALIMGAVVFIFPTSDITIDDDEVCQTEIEAFSFQESKECYKLNK